MVPLLLGVDEEGGPSPVCRPRWTTCPQPIPSGRSPTPTRRMDACFALGQTLAAECAAFGFNLDFAPVMDIWSNPDNTVIGRRAFGSDLAPGGLCRQRDRLGYAQRRGHRRGQTLPRAWGYGGDSHYGLPTVEKTVDELMEFELVPFRQAIEGTCVYGAGGRRFVHSGDHGAHILCRH